MLGLSYGEIFLILGATAALVGPKDLPIIGRTAGRIVGRAIGYIQLARGQFENVMQNPQINQMSKEVQDLQAQVRAIQHGVTGTFYTGPNIRTVMNNPDQISTAPGATILDTLTNVSQVTKVTIPQQNQQQQHQYDFKAETSILKEYDSGASVASDLHSRATTYARLAESQASKNEAIGSNDRPGLLTVLPVSAEDAKLLPKRQGEVTGSDIVLEAVVEAEVARMAKEYMSQPQDQIKLE